MFVFVVLDLALDLYLSNVEHFMNLCCILLIHTFVIFTIGLLQLWKLYNEQLW